MNVPNSTPASSLLILGCGYLGSELAQQAVCQGLEVDVLTRNPDTLALLKKCGVRRTVQATLQSHTWHPELNPAAYRAICLTVGSSESTPEGYHESYIKGVDSVRQWCEASATRVIYTGSISVYGPSDGSWIDESTAPEPRDWRGQTLLESEQLLRSVMNDRLTVLRLGGIYGPGRDRFLRSGGSADTTASNSYYLNLIHVADAARAMLRTAVASHDVSGTYNLTDNHPFLRSELDAFVRKHELANPATNAVSGTRRRSAPANRRIRSTRIQTLLDWSPSFSSVYNALRDLAS